MLVVNHLRQPFSCNYSENNATYDISVSLNQRIAAVAAAILAGGVAAFLRGNPLVAIPVFYAVAGFFKYRMIEHLKKATDEDHALRLRNGEEPVAGRHVDFNVARAREFDRGEVPNAVGQQDSLVLDDLQQHSGPQRENARPCKKKGVSEEKQFPYVPHRCYPPLGSNDTIIQDEGTGMIVSIHGKVTMFQDTEIKAIHPFQREVPLDSAKKVLAQITEDGTAVIQQQAMRGCTAAASAMLIYDLGGKVDLVELRTTNLGMDEDMVRTIKRAGFTPILRVPESLDHLQQLIQEAGPAIVSISDPEGGGHVIVVDAVTPDGVTFRDPYHGWKITVGRDALEKRAWKGNIIQAKKG